MAATPRLSWNLRVAPDDQELIDRAVSASGLTRTDFLRLWPHPHGFPAAGGSHRRSAAAGGADLVLRFAGAVRVFSAGARCATQPQ